ncbi:hypothetical protein SNEBB_005537 [Seison nebaliae]|nr:hypothetical protein SNEBB_005537 [Seison nebaliae]
MSIHNKRIFIIGATGVGKTKLSIELAKIFNGEIVNADSMQIYTNLGILTSRPSTKEMNDIPHHLFNIIDGKETDFNVSKYEKIAERKIEEIHKRNHLPIIVGGTNYYIESLIWNLVSDNQLSNMKDFEEKYSDWSTSKLYDEVKEDALKRRIHHNDRRKLLRCLQYRIELNVSWNEMLERKRLKTNNFRGSLKSDSSNSIIIWAHLEKSKHLSNLQQRQHEMEKEGLWEECQKYFHDSSSPIDFQKGLNQSIGLKYIYDYYIFKNNLDGTIDGNEDKLRSEWNNAMTKMTTRTIQYTSVQNKWIRSRLVRRVRNDENIPHLFQINMNNSNSMKHSLQLVQCLLEKPNYLIHLNPMTSNSLGGFRTVITIDKNCIICDNQHFIIQEQWEEHLRSRRHQKRVKSLIEAENFKRYKRKNVKIEEEKMSTEKKV